MYHITRTLLLTLSFWSTSFIEASEDLRYNKDYNPESHAALWFLTNRDRLLLDSMVPSTRICRYTWLGRVFADFTGASLTDGPRLHFERIHKNKIQMAPFVAEQATSDQLDRYNRFRARILSTARFLGVLCEERLTPEEKDLTERDTTPYIQPKKSFTGASFTKKKRSRNKILEDFLEKAAESSSKIMRFSDNTHPVDQQEYHVQNLLETSQRLPVYQEQLPMQSFATQTLRVILTTEDLVIPAPGYRSIQYFFGDVSKEIV